MSAVNCTTYPPLQPNSDISGKGVCHLPPALTKFQMKALILGYRTGPDQLPCDRLPHLALLPCEIQT
jgi:hypothetical protein